ncbi:GNAT family N-acetyltransferase [Massilia horti]|uniref:N-acetyltransferase n=1 Tax=Massilia horti TaxID=2562153 RepID=A0A4Y9T5Y6_9BURK|nr:GNAT family N-acetyltransferase [Massilia horti]TFW32483.1 N-acetyltransferase [Massilia horti]
MPPSVDIRRALAEDAPALTALMHASAAYRGAYAAILDGYAVTPAQIGRDLLYVALKDGQPLGFYSLVHATCEPELDLMFVSDTAQGCGVGALLFQHMQESARSLGIGRVKIVSHPPAEAFYLRMGAQRIGSILPAGRVTWARPLLSLPVEPGQSQQ